jgi:hypothetical protein
MATNTTHDAWCDQAAHGPEHPHCTSQPIMIGTLTVWVSSDPCGPVACLEGRDVTLGADGLAVLITHLTSVMHMIGDLPGGQTLAETGSSCT